MRPRATRLGGVHRNCHSFRTGRPRGTVTGPKPRMRQSWEQKLEPGGPHGGFGAVPRGGGEAEEGGASATEAAQCTRTHLRLSRPGWEGLRDRLDDRRRALPGRSQRVLRRRGIRARRRAPGPHRPARSGGKRACRGGTARDARAQPAAVGMPARHHVREPRPRLDRRAGVRGSAARALRAAARTAGCDRDPQGDAFLHVVLGELVPKNLAIAAPERVALWVAIPIRGFTRLFQPLIWLFNEGANRVVRLLGVEPQSELRSVHTLEEIRLLLEESRRAGAIELPHANIFERTFEFPDKRVHDATVPRSDVHAVATDHDVSEVLDLASSSGHSRFPVHDEKSSEYIGVVHLADMLRADHQDPGARVKDGMREPLVVPESLRLDVLLRQMNEARTHFAIVVDEYGSTSGIITLDDVLAELVGEIAGEHRDPSETVRRLENGTYRVAGQIRIEELHRATGCSLPEGDYETLGGFISQRLGRIARSGDTIDYDGWRMRVVSVQRRRILTVDVDPPRVHANRA